MAVVAVGAEDWLDNRTPRSAATGLRNCLRTKRELSMLEKERETLKRRKYLRKLRRMRRKRKRGREKQKKEMMEIRMIGLRARRRRRAVRA